jgi:hypothetical protein
MARPARAKFAVSATRATNLYRYHNSPAARAAYSLTLQLKVAAGYMFPIIVRDTP